MNRPLIQIKDMDAGYQKKVVLSGINFSVQPNDFIGIIGPNGGGKTTLVKVIMGLIRPMKGTIITDLDRREIGYLPQGSQPDEQFPISVREVVASGLAHGLQTGKRQDLLENKRIDDVLERVGLRSLESRAIGELSGGELQRTMLARAIISSPRLLVLDEPDTYVDNRFEQELYGLLRELNDKITILLVTHDVGIISPYIKSIACVNRDLHYHASNEISEEQLKVYNCPIEIISHGTVPHRVMKTHPH